MVDRRCSRILPAALAGWLIVAALPVLAAEPWMLMGREGGCVEIAQAAARKELLSGIESPDQLADRLSGRGEGFQREDVAKNGVAVARIDIPKRGMSLIFVPRSLCR